MLKRFGVLAFAMQLSSFAMAQVWVIDVRTPEEVAAGKVEGAVNIEYQDVVAGVQKLGVKKDDTVYLYCRSGRRSGIALESLQSAGFGNVGNLGSLQQAQEWKASQASASTRECLDAQTPGQPPSKGC